MFGSRKISPGDFKKLQAENSAVVLVDVRNPEEFAAGHIGGAQLLPLPSLPESVAGALPNKAALIVVYCQAGMRSAKAASILKKLGYTEVLDLGGIASWPYEIEK